jgi:hypothetical protein
MNIFYLSIVIIIAFLYTNSHLLRKNKKITAISISLFSIILYKHTELFYLLLALSIIIFFSTVKKEKFQNFNSYKNRYNDKEFNEYGFIDNIGERLIENKYDDRDFYPKIDNKIVKDKFIIKDNMVIDTKYKKKSRNIIRDGVYLVNNLGEQIQKYGYQNQLNDELYNSEYDIYNFENDQPVDQINTPEWWERYEQLEDNKNIIQDKLDDNSGKILDLQNDNKIITRNLNKNKEQLKNLRQELDNNFNIIDKNQKCTVYGMDKITEKYIHPKKQNKYYGEVNAPDPYENISNKEKYSTTQLLKAYRKNPEIISNCIDKIKEEEQENSNRNDNQIYNDCKNKVELKTVYLPPNISY